jgi:secretion/DNA translocation related TadE-like protein
MRVGAGTGAACSQASALARAMGAAVAQCVVEDLDVVIIVETRVPLGRIGGGPARATARAGPVDSS